MKDTATEVRTLGAVQCGGFILFFNIKIHVPDMYNSINRKSVSPVSTKMSDKYLLNIALKRSSTLTLSSAPSETVGAEGLWHSASWSGTHVAYFHFCELEQVLNFSMCAY